MSESILTLSKLTLLCWKKPGAPEGVLHILNQFYVLQERWFAVRGHFAPQPVTCSMSLLQGCPASPALRNSMMTVSILFNKTQHPTVKLAIFLGG